MIWIFGKIYDIKDFKWPQPAQQWSIHRRQSYSDLEAEHYSSQEEEEDDYDFY